MQDQYPVCLCESDCSILLDTFCRVIHILGFLWLCSAGPDPPTLQMEKVSVKADTLSDTWRYFWNSHVRPAAMQWTQNCLLGSCKWSKLKRKKEKYHTQELKHPNLNYIYHFLMFLICLIWLDDKQFVQISQSFSLEDANGQVASFIFKVVMQRTEFKFGCTVYYGQFSILTAVNHHEPVNSNAWLGFSVSHGCLFWLGEFILIQKYGD